MDAPKQSLVETVSVALDGSRQQRVGVNPAVTRTARVDAERVRVNDAQPWESTAGGNDRDSATGGTGR